ncbi:MAG: hypothetical protein IJH38_04105 [Clostridia bacterium]|nr:hypothetical protein [Clostridia bacterium]
MHYRMLLWPHANARYQLETVNLALAELRMMLERLAPEAEAAALGQADLPGLDIHVPSPLDGAVLRALSRHSLLYALFEVRPGGLLLPVTGRALARVGADLPAILKYKGKTNEMFLQLLINAALYSGDFWQQAETPLRLLDPMCGKGTCLFVGANFGWDALGADVDRAGLKEAEQYFRRYLEYHRFKHTLTRASRTLPGGGNAPESRFAYTPGADEERRQLSLVGLDAAMSAQALEKERYHLIVCDLPYGVHHDARLKPGSGGKGNWLEALLARALPGWKRAMKVGGAVALSFNTRNISLSTVRGLMAEAGFTVLEGGPREGLAHWVEQAITRDIAIGRRED